MRTDERLPCLFGPRLFARSFASLLFVVLTASGASAFEHPHYNIKAAIDVEKKEIRASQTVRFTNNSSVDLTNLYFHIYPNRKFTHLEKEFANRFAGFFKVDLFPGGFQSGRLNIASLKENDKDLTFKIEGADRTILNIVLDAPLRPGQTMEVAMAYTVSIPHMYGRFGWNENIFALSRWYPILSVHNEMGWQNYPFYPFHRPFFSEAAYYNLELTVPKEQVVIHSGHLKEEQGRGAVKTLVIGSQQPIRELSLAMSPDYKVFEEQWEGTTLRSYYLPGDEFYGRQALIDAKGLMAYYSKLFGHYFYKDFSIAPVYLGHGGEQMSNLVYIDTRVYKLPKFLTRYFDFLISHETGHQWFYNLVGMDEFTEMWLEEGVHSHFILSYLEQKYGANAEVIDYPKWFEPYQWLLPHLTFRRTGIVRYQTIVRGGSDRSVIGELSSFHEPSSIFSLTYGKGSRIVGMLKALVGDEAFGKTFRRVFEEYRFKNLSIADFIRISEEESGQDLKTFFNQWLYSDQHLNYAVSKVEGSRVSLQNRGGIKMPVEVLIRFNDRTEETIIWDGQNKEETITLDKKAKIKQVVIDPWGKLLDVDLTNNRWPRKLYVKSVPLYLPLYDQPLFLPEESYNLVFGPEISNGLGVKASLQKPYDQNFYAATDYEIGEAQQHSRIGYQLNNIFHTQAALGAELSNTTDFEDGDEDLVSAKAFLRRELWPASYGLGAINDHATLYVVRNREMDTSLLFGGQEDNRNLSYLRKNESIIGTNIHFGRYGTYPDPKQGYKVDAVLETSQHFWDATQYFYRASIDLSKYQPVTAQSKLAYRLKYGFGFPDDKNLYELGGWDGLRGFDRKSVRGSSALLGSVEYRFPLIRKIGFSILDHTLTLDSVGGVVFFDAGESWYDDFSDGKFKKDAGFGLRFGFSVGSFLEKIIVRADVAQPIDAPKENTHFWFGLNHAF